MKALLIAATVGLAVLGTQVRADHSTLPPKAQELFGHKAMGVSGPNLVHTGPMGPAAKAPISRERKGTGSAASEPNLVRSQTYTGRNPFGAQAREFEIAPLGKGKQCEPGCKKDCCAKK